MWSKIQAVFVALVIFICAVISASNCILRQKLKEAKRLSEFPTNEISAREHHRRLARDGWRWYETRGYKDDHGKIYPALWGAYFRAEHAVHIEFRDGGIHIEVYDPNTWEEIEIDYGKSILYPMMVWEPRGTKVTFSVGDIYENDVAMKFIEEAAKEIDGNIIVFGDDQYHVRDGGTFIGTAQGGTK